MDGKSVSKNIFNWSNQVLTENKKKILEKGINFVPTPEKLDLYQIKKDLERLGRDNKLRMYYKTEQALKFSKKWAFKVPSNCSGVVWSKDDYLLEASSQVSNK